jgi:hypothetical protein
MKGWYVKRVKRINLVDRFPEAEGLWADFAEMDSFTYGEAQDLRRRYERLSKSEDPEKNEQAMKELLGIMVPSWNITDPDTGEPLKSPKESKNAIDRLPMEVLSYILEKGFGTGTEEGPLANESET